MEYFDQIKKDKTAYLASYRALKIIALKIIDSLFNLINKTNKTYLRPLSIADLPLSAEMPQGPKNEQDIDRTILMKKEIKD